MAEVVREVHIVVTALILEKLVYLAFAVFAVGFLVKIGREHWRHRALMNRMDAYGRWVKACVARPEGMTDMEFHLVDRLSHGQNPGYRGPWEGS